MNIIRPIIIIIAIFASVIGVSMKIYSCKSQDICQEGNDTRYYNVEVVNDTLQQPCNYTVIFNEEYIRVIDQINQDTYDLVGHYNATQMQFYPDSNALGVNQVRILNHALYLIDTRQDWKLKLVQTE